MTQFRTVTDAERAALRLHGLDTRRPSQLSDAFVLGMRYAYSAKVLEPIPQDQATRDQVAAVMLQHGTPAQQAEALDSAAYEVVYFRRSPHESEDWLRVPAGTAKQHVREELITRIVPGEVKPEQHPWLKR